MIYILGTELRFEVLVPARLSDEGRDRNGSLGTGQKGMDEMVERVTLDKTSLSVLQKACVEIKAVGQDGHL